MVSKSGQGKQKPWRNSREHVFMGVVKQKAFPQRHFPLNIDSVAQVLRRRIVSDIIEEDSPVLAVSLIITVFGFKFVT